MSLEFFFQGYRLTFVGICTILCEWSFILRIFLEFIMKIQDPPANRAIFKFKKNLKYWISWNICIYKEVHTLAFAEISESVVLKQNTTKKHNISFHSLHTQDALHSATHTQQADREHYSWPYVTPQPGFLKSLPVSAVQIQV